jgi:hypothetical protein
MSMTVRMFQFTVGDVGKGFPILEGLNVYLGLFL